MIVVLDTFPTSCVSKASGVNRHSQSDQCRQWIYDLEEAGHRILVPAISYYEALRELEQRQAGGQVGRLKSYCLQPQRFIPLTTEHLDLAARLWGKARREGQPTADPHALDGDVLLAAQVLSLDVEAHRLIVATTNPVHINRFVPADFWLNINP